MLANIQDDRSNMPTLEQRKTLIYQGGNWCSAYKTERLAKQAASKAGAERKAFDEGYKAYRDALRFCFAPPVCPYDASSPLQKAWDCGADKAFNELGA